MTVPSFSAVTMFAEDIRQEVSGQVSLIGIFPDNMALNNFPGILPKLTIYSRIVFPIDRDFDGDLFTTLIDPLGEAILHDQTTVAELTSLRQPSVDQGANVFTLITHMQAAAFPIPAPGRFEMSMKYGKAEMTTGFLNVVKGQASSD